MLFRGRDLESVDISDLRTLVEDGVSEGRKIEYKENLPGNTDSDKKEFLADISAFSNTSGGHFLIGIRESSGVPEDIVGIDVDNLDAEILRLENMIRDGIEPRPPGLKTYSVSLENGKVVIVIQIPRSWALPHMVTYKGHSKFFSRNSAGKYQLDVTELRAAYALSDSTTERIKNFRMERINNIVSENYPTTLPESPKIVLHIVPFGAFHPAGPFDIVAISEESTHLRPMNASGWSNRFNFDGYLSFNGGGDNTTSYVQIFRNGSIEAVECRLLAPFNGKKSIPSLAYELEILRALQHYLPFQEKSGIEPPLIVMLSLIGVKDYIMGVDYGRFSYEDTYPIDRNMLLLPEVLFEQFNLETSKVMRPIFDAVWNAAGWPRSMNYNENGVWQK